LLFCQIEAKKAVVAIGKARAACAQSFAPWQQATTEFTRRDHSPRTLVVAFNRSQVNIGRASTPRSLCCCLFAPHIYIIVLRAHPVRGESHIQRNATGEVATTSTVSQSTKSLDMLKILGGRHMATPMTTRTNKLKEFLRNALKL